MPINPADFPLEQDPQEEELLKWFRHCTKEDKKAVVELAQLYGYTTMVSLLNDDAVRRRQKQLKEKKENGNTRYGHR